MTPTQLAERLLSEWGQWRRHPWHVSIEYPDRTAESGIGEGRGEGLSDGVQFALNKEEPVAVTVVEQMEFTGRQWTALYQAYRERSPIAGDLEAARVAAVEKLAEWIERQEQSAA